MLFLLFVFSLLGGLAGLLCFLGGVAGFWLVCVVWLVFGWFLASLGGFGWFGWFLAGLAGFES